MSNSLCSFLERGTEKSQDFMSERIVENTKSKGFWDPMPRTKILTFSDMRKPLLSKTKDMLAVDSEVLFHRILFILKFRDVNLETVLQPELTTELPSMFRDDGMMRKTVKSDLAKNLEETCTVLQRLPQQLPLHTSLMVCQFCKV